MHAMKKEMLPIFAHLPGVTISADALSRAGIALDDACAACDGSFDTVEAVRIAGESLQSAGVECFDHAESAANCARRCCDHLGDDYDN